MMVSAAFRGVSIAARSRLRKSARGVGQMRLRTRLDGSMRWLRVATSGYSQRLETPSASAYRQSVIVGGFENVSWGVATSGYG